MVYFDLTHSATGAAIWALIMGMGIMQMYISRIPWGMEIFLVTFLPFIKFLSKSEYFAVGIVPLFVSCFLTTIMLRMFKLNTKLKKALEEPSSDIVRSSTGVVGLGVFFMVVMVVVSTQTNLYNSYKNA